MKLSDANKQQRNRPAGYCSSPEQHMPAGRCAGDIGPCAEEGGTGGKQTAADESVRAESHLRLEHVGTKTNKLYASHR